MNAGHIVVLLAIAFAFTLPAFVFAARQKGWPYGQIFAKGKIPTMLAIGCISLLAGKLISATIHGDLSLLWLLYVPVACFFGAPLVLVLLGRWSGIVALVVAPALAVASMFFAL